MKRTEVNLIKDTIRSFMADIDYANTHPGYVYDTRHISDRMDCLLWLLEATGNEDPELTAETDKYFEEA